MTQIPQQPDSGITVDEEGNVRMAPTGGVEPAEATETTGQEPVPAPPAPISPVMPTGYTPPSVPANVDEADYEWVPPERPTVWYAYEGDPVNEVQEHLVRLGLYDPKYGDAPGVFGATTDAAVRGFQQLAGLHVDGIVGPVTWLNLTTWGV